MVPFFFFFFLCGPILSSQFVDAKDFTFIIHSVRASLLNMRYFRAKKSTLTMGNLGKATIKVKYICFPSILYSVSSLRL